VEIQCNLLREKYSQWGVGDVGKRTTQSGATQIEQHGLEGQRHSMHKGHRRGIVGSCHGMVPKPNLSLAFKGLINSIGLYNGLIL